MTDIFDEVEEDLRRERLKRLWDRIGVWVIAGAVLIVVVTAGWRGWVAWETARARDAGDRFQAALETARESSGGAGLDALSAIAADGPAGYALLARFRLGAEQADAGDTEAAIATLRAIARDGGVDPLYQDLARIRTGHLLLDAGDSAAAAEEVAVLAERQTGAWTHAAKEVMGLSAYAEGSFGEARRWFSALEEDPATPQGLRGRAQLMVTLLDGRIAGAPADAEDAPEAEAPTTDPAEATQ